MRGYNFSHRGYSRTLKTPNSPPLILSHHHPLTKNTVCFKYFLFFDTHYTLLSEPYITFSSEILEPPKSFSQNFFLFFKLADSHSLLSSDSPRLTCPKAMSTPVKPSTAPHSVPISQLVAATGIITRRTCTRVFPLTWQQLATARQHPATPGNTRQHPATADNTRQHTATPRQQLGNTLQHSAILGNTAAADH